MKTLEEIKEHEEYIKQLKELVKECKKDPSIAMDIAKKAGIYDEDGNLTERYK